MYVHYVVFTGDTGFGYSACVPKGKSAIKLGIGVCVYGNSFDIPMV